MAKCDLLKKGECLKFGNHKKCKPTNMSIFERPDGLEVVEAEQICRKASIFGNSFFMISRGQLKALEEGRVLYNLDEYGTFIALERRE